LIVTGKHGLQFSVLLCIGLDLAFVYRREEQSGAVQELDQAMPPSNPQEVSPFIGLVDGRGSRGARRGAKWSGSSESERGGSVRLGATKVF
jgi:hypothetical protein